MDESTFKYKIAHWLEEIAHARISFKMSGRSKMYLNRTNDYLNNYLTAREKHFKVLVQQYTSANSFTESHILAQYHLQSSTKVILLLVAIGKFGKSGIKEKDCKVI
jgi:hypothetical protein